MAGAVRCQGEAADDAGLIVGPHGREDFEVIAALIALARARMGGRLLYACTGPVTASGIPRLSVQHRAVTARALTAAGSTPASTQRYFLRNLTSTPPSQPAYPLADVTAVTSPPGWQLEIVDTDGRHLATAILQVKDHLQDA
ncbi:hypothetical protein ACF08N_36440 [Streptomyces sp. NPDC015127]|uniref:hypothetical protein n=1 Tax=Streptomyces sp. NPDC015127 TaxID=3364939 RepID=UPI0036F8FF31